MITYRQLATELAAHPFPDEPVGTVENRAPLPDTLDNITNMALGMGGTLILIYKSRAGESKILQFSNAN